MASTVWHWNLRANLQNPPAKKLAKLLTASGFAEALEPGEFVAVKAHFGEGGNHTFISPVQMKPLLDVLLERETKPFLTDTSTLYAGQRGNGVDHAMQARDHGFDSAVLGVPVIMADGLRSTHEKAVPATGRFFSECWIAADIMEADRLLTISHFKGHVLAGVGCSLKNIGMGCASRKGKMQQHKSMGPILDVEKCVGCSSCVQVCQPGALRMGEEGKITIDYEACLGCGACFHACRTHALQVDWKIERSEFIGRMMEYAAAVISNLKRPAFHVAFATRITPDCDCASWSDAPLAGDVGVLGSWDPVALDQACLDLVNAAPGMPGSGLPEGYQAGQDKFRAINDGFLEGHGLDIAEALGIGTREYTLQKV